MTKKKGAKKSLKDWQTKILTPYMKKNPERANSFITTSSKSVERLYTPEDIPDFNYQQDLGFPG